MQGASPNSNNTESPKTPGGISKSLLTPCRRVGLSKKWKRVGCSPFISPLSTQNSTLERKDDKQIIKRKKCDKNEILSETCKTPSENFATNANLSTPQPTKKLDENNDITTTPSRISQIPRKLSKNLSCTLKDDQEMIKIDGLSSQKTIKSLFAHECQKTDNVPNKEKIMSKDSNPIYKDNVSKPHTQSSKSEIKLSLKKTPSRNNCNSEFKCEVIKPKEKSPNNLIKECIVVIEKEILKTNNKQTRCLSQESDSDPDVPLSTIKKEKITLHTSNDDDFKPESGKVSQRVHLEASQSSHEDIDKKTILIKKSYDKVTKLPKAKSTGSITQRDIDDLTARIERKKKLLMAKAMSPDTEELRSLIIKWQKGCQDALLELLELMKKKLPDQQNMAYSEILQTLRIPPELVGYDVDNDCFITPDDTNMLLSTFKL